MADFLGKFKNLLNLGKDDKDDRFRGPAQKLGTAQAASRQAKPPQGQASSQHPQPSPQQIAAPGARGIDWHVAQATASGVGGTPTPPQPFGGTGRTLSQSVPPKSQDVVLDRAVMLNSPTGREASQLHKSHPPPPVQLQLDAWGRQSSGSELGASGSAASPSILSTPTPAEARRLRGMLPTADTAGPTSQAPLPSPLRPAGTALAPGQGGEAAAAGSGQPPVGGGLESEDEATSFQLQHCLALTLSADSDAQGQATCSALLRVVSNVLSNTSEPKYRTLRLANARIKESITCVPGAVEFLECVGFCLQLAAPDTPLPAHSSATPELDAGTLVLASEAPLGPLLQAKNMVQQVMSAHGWELPQQPPSASPVHCPAHAPPSVAPSGLSTAGAGSASNPPPSGPPGSAASALQSGSRSQQAAPPVTAPPRMTQVVLPVAPDVAVPDWFFEMTGAELKASFFAALRRREADSTLQTRTMRERAAADGSAAQPAAAARSLATVRVRFPEAVCLQGVFHVRETTAALFQWVTEALRDPGVAYELIGPDRRALGPAATVAAAGLAPSSVVNFRPLMPSPGRGRQHTSFLRDDLLRSTQALE